MSLRTRKALVPAALGLAGVALAIVALRAPARTYVPPAREMPVEVPHALAGDAPPGCVVRAFTVEGICCAGCAPKMHRALMAVEGVEGVAVDPLRQEVSAWVRAEVPLEPLVSALTFAQYTATAR